MNMSALYEHDCYQSFPHLLLKSFYRSFSLIRCRFDENVDEPASERTSKQMKETSKLAIIVNKTRIQSGNGENVTTRNHNSYKM